MRGMVFPLTEHESNELFRQYCRPGGPLSRQNGESMKQYVSRRRCWILLVQMDPVIYLSEGHRSDMLLDLSGLTHEERVMVQPSISNERDFDRVAEALIIQHPRIHPRESQRQTKGKGKDGFKRVDNPNTRWFREKGKGQHIGSGKCGTSARRAKLTSVEDYDYYHDKDLDESVNAYQAHNDPVDPGSDDGEEAPDYDGDEENDTFSSEIALDDVTVYEAAELDAIALHGTTISIPKQVRTWYKRAHKLSFLSERTEEKEKGTAKERARAATQFDRRICRWRTDDDA